jgi:hypothetical protein
MLLLRHSKEASRNYNIMRPTTFDPRLLRQYLLRHKIATLSELKGALGTDVGLTVFRKLKPLGYLSSYSHRGGYYTLVEIPRFDDNGLWSHKTAWFSRYGTLLSTVESFVNSSPQGFFATDLADILHVDVQDVLRQLAERGRLQRSEVYGRYLYTAMDRSIRRQQYLSRRTAQSVPVVANVTALEVLPEQLQSAILLFYSVLDEQQRRLYAGLESIKLGHGGDTLLADFLHLDAHTVARGRQQLLDGDVTSGGRTRRPGAGRIPTEKKRPK